MEYFTGVIKAKKRITTPAKSIYCKVWQICCVCFCRWPYSVLDFKSRFCYLLLCGVVLLAVHSDPSGLCAHLHLSQKETEENHLPSRQWQSSASISTTICGKSRYSHISPPHMISSNCFGFSTLLKTHVIHQ